MMWNGLVKWYLIFRTTTQKNILNFNIKHKIMSRVVTFGEIMLRLAPEGFLRFSQANDYATIEKTSQRSIRTN